MKPTEFVKVNSQFWGDHLKAVSEHLPVSHRLELAGPLLYPRLMVLTETPDWNILELVGVSREYRSLEVKRQKVASIDQYFGGAASATGVVVVVPDEKVFQDSTIATEHGRNALGTNFPASQSLIGNELVGTGDAGKLLSFAPGNYSVFQRVLLASSASSSVRLHWTFLAIAIHRSEPADKYRDFLQQLVTSAPHLDPVGTVGVPRGEVEQSLKSDAFASTYLMHGLQKTTVGQFLTQHEEILLSAFDATRLIQEPFLEWRDGTPGADEVAITPDFILERADGSHVVGDLQLPLVETAAGAKGGKKRRRSFAAPVRDGAPQLARYDEYFQTPENRAFAKSKYGLEISEPRKLLVIGSQEIVDPAEFADAAATSSLEIVDYDTILRLHLAAKS